MRRRFFVVFNPIAGRASRAHLDAVMASIRAEVAAAECETLTLKSGEPIRSAVERSRGRFDAVIAAGGDGTIREVACGLIDSTTPLGIVPIGTGNVLAHELALPRDAAALARVLVHGGVREVRPARANGEPFLLMAGIGIDGRIVARLDHALKNRIGKLAYMPPVLAAMVAPPDRLAVTIDGTVHEATWAVVAKARHFGGDFELSPWSDMAGADLTVLMFRGARIARIGDGLALLTGRMAARARREGVLTVVSTRRVAVTTAQGKPAPVQVDGDVFATTPLAVDADGGRVSLIVPAV
jgi:YegS/Rv2252/BmrU family lipid kinase